MNQPLSLLKRVIGIGAGVLLGCGSVHAASVQAVWRITGSSTLPVKYLSTTQWVDVVLETDASGLQQYELDVFIDPLFVEYTGDFEETPPQPLVSATPGATFTDDVLSSFEAQQVSATYLEGAARVVVGSVEIVANHLGDAIVEPWVFEYVDGSGHPQTPDEVSASIEIPKLNYRYQVVASTESAEFDSFYYGGELGDGGKVVFLDSEVVPIGSFPPQRIIQHHNGTLQTLATTGNDFLGFGMPHISDNGNVTFMATDGYQNIGNNEVRFKFGHYLYDGSLTRFFHVTTGLAPTVGFDATGESVLINNHKQVVFPANYFDLHQEPDGAQSIAFDTIQWMDLTDPNSVPVELYRGSDPNGLTVQPAPYNGILGPNDFNNAGQVLFYAYTVGAFPDGQGELLLGGVENGQPVEPILVASETEGTYEEIGGYAQLNDDGSVIFEAIASGDVEFTLYRWNQGQVETILAPDNELDIIALGWLGFVSRDHHLVFMGQNTDGLMTVYMWTPDAGIQEVLVLGDGFRSGDVLLGPDEQPIRPSEITWGLVQFLIGIDDLGRIALNIEWEDGVETLLFATPLLPPSNVLSVSSAGVGVNGFQLTFQGEPGLPLTLEATSNFSQWNVITNFTTGEAAVPLTDPDAVDLPMRFYRVVSTPPSL